MSELNESDEGQWLIDHRRGLEPGGAGCVGRVAQFDQDRLWALDGQFCCASWLVWRMKMARSTAFEKVRVANELRRRPIISAAFRRGDLSYSVVRIIARLDRPDPEIDEALVQMALTPGVTLADIERVVRSYLLYADQDRPPAEDAQPSRNVEIKRGHDGGGSIVINLSDMEIEEFAAALQAFLDLRYRPRPVDESAAADSDSEQTIRTPVDESAAADSPVADEAPAEEANRRARRADAFMDLLAAALSGADGGHAAGDDRYMVHLVSRDQGASFTFLNGTPAHPVDAAAVCCDTSRVTHTVGDQGEPLSLGRKTREWSTAQRRAISVRDGGCCRFPGCEFARTDIHHLQAWEDGGRTDTANGCCLCRRHHRMLHAGYHVEGDPDGQLLFYRPGGTYVGSTLAATHGSGPAAFQVIRRPSIFSRVPV